MIVNMKIVNSQVVIVKMNKSVHMIHVEKIQMHYVKMMQSYE